MTVSQDMVSKDEMVRWCARLIEKSPDFPALEACLDAIAGLDSLDDLPSGTRVLLRGDLDVVVDDNGAIGDDVRLRSLLATLRHGCRRGWVLIVYGHRGRDPQLSLQPVATHLQNLLRQEGLENPTVGFVDEWLDDQRGHVLDAAAKQIAALPDGSVAVLENTRRYKLEQLLWKAKPEDLPELADRLANYANSIRGQLAAVHVNEGFAASNVDLSSTVVPFTMDRAVLGKYVDHELREHVTRTRQAELVVFSGIKTNKLDDLERILNRGRVRMVIAAGSLAIALKKADADLAGEAFELGLNGDPSQKTYVSPQRVEQAVRMIRSGRDRGVEFVLPIDFILGDGTASDTIPPDGAQFDVGPKTVELQAKKVGEFIERHGRKSSVGEGPAVAFHNGVFGKFEEERFARGTRKFISQLKRLHDAGVEVYVGGGEGGAALHRYGDESWVTHCYTAGGTILKALGNEPIPYLKALYLKATGGWS